MVENKKYICFPNFMKKKSKSTKMPDYLIYEQSEKIDWKKSVGGVWTKKSKKGSGYLYISFGEYRRKDVKTDKKSKSTKEKKKVVKF